MTYLSETDINQTLVLEFFLMISRFEFALKITKYAKGDNNRAEPDWAKYAKDICEQFNKNKTKELLNACEFYLQNPPKKQVLVNGALDWSKTLPNNNTKEPEILISLVRRVRNNLFHGGKYNAQLHDETARNEELLKAGIIILQECLNVSPDVKQAFDGAAI